MIKLLIVDDEQTTREGLKKFIPWNKLRIDRVQTAKNGVEALQLAEDFKPDILLTDIKMPQMDGILLAAEFRKVHPDCKIIFLSSYSDKEYLKSAIQYKVVDYVEKPVNISEIQKVITAAVNIHIEEQVQKNNIKMIEDSLVESRPFLHQAFTLQLIKEDKKNFSLTPYDKLFQKFSAGEKYIVATVILNWEDGTDTSHINRIKHTILDVFCRNPQGYPDSCTIGFVDNREIVFVAANQQEEWIDDRQIMQNLLNDLMSLSQSSFSLSIGYVSQIKDLADIPMAYRQAVRTAKKQFYHSTNQIFSFDRKPPKTLQIDQSILDKFLILLKMENWQEALNTIRLITDLVRDAGDDDIEMVRNLYYKLLIMIIKSTREQYLRDHIIENEEGFIWRQIAKMLTLTELSDYLETYIMMIYKQMDEQDPVSKKIYETMKFIQNNYGNKEMSIQFVAEHAFLSQTYLCCLFKKTTGKTINEYITETRIEKAKELLNNSELKLYEISELIGFADTNYFSTVFSKAAGCSPSKYRSKYYL